MRYAKDRKDQTRRNIIRSAAKLFAAKGFKATSIDAIMRDCKLTRGGFYAHFRSKSQLYRQAMTAATQSASRATSRARAQTDDWLNKLLAEYLQMEDRGFFATDVASTDPDVRAAYANACNALIARISAHGPFREEGVLSVASMLIGAVAMARTIDDASLKGKLIASVKLSVESLLASAAPSFFWEPPTRADRLRAQN